MLSRPVNARIVSISVRRIPQGGTDRAVRETFGRAAVWRPSHNARRVTQIKSLPLRCGGAYEKHRLGGWPFLF